MHLWQITKHLITLVRHACMRTHAGNEAWVPAGMALPNLPDAARMSMMPMFVPTEPELSETPPTGCAQVRVWKRGKEDLGVASIGPAPSSLADEPY